VGIRVATFNLLHGIALPRADAPAAERRGPPVATDPGPLRDAVRAIDADVIGLQEVDHDQPRSGHADQTAEVAAALDAPHWRFVAALHGTPGTAEAWADAPDDHEVHAGSDVDGPAADGPAYGVGLVSRLPVHEWRVLRFPPAPFSLPLMVPGEGRRPQVVRVPDEPRVALAAVVRGARGVFTVVTAHLSFVPGYNVRQLRAIARWTAELPGPVLIAGDLNLPGAIPRLAVGWRALARGATYPSFGPRVQFDHVLGRGLAEGSVHGSRVHPLPVSDHCALSVDVDL
jgi:endonuclease/exonuclease/phosphatase family metal-dependent hydrolase